jgi:hypothetical protein
VFFLKEYIIGLKSPLWSHGHHLFSKIAIPVLCPTQGQMQISKKGVKGQKKIALTYLI